MKNKRDEILLGLGFGDIRGDEAERASAQLTAEESAFVDELRGMKLDLQRLQVPEHQLSTERLRGAILDQGLQPNRVTTPWFRWALAPVAAAAIAVFAFQTMWPQNGRSENGLAKVENSSSGRVALGSDPVIEAPITEPGYRFEPDHWFDGGDSSPVVVAQSPDSELVVNRKSSSRRSYSASRAALTRESARNVGFETAGSPSLSMTAPVTTVPGAASMMADAEVSSSGVILIGSETDSATGANRAVEVQDSRDVLIGG